MSDIKLPSTTEFKASVDAALAANLTMQASSAALTEGDRKVKCGSYVFTCFDMTWGAAVANAIVNGNKAHEKIRYLIVGKEKCGKTGRDHMQCYVELEGSARITDVQSYLGIPAKSSWFQKRHGTPDQASTYCKKEGQFWEYGAMGKGQGHRSDLSSAIADLKSGMDNVGLIENHPTAYLKYFKGFDRVRIDLAKKDRRDTQTLVLCGPSGTGKSHHAFEQYPNAYRFAPGPTGAWWDGYNGHKEVVIDDFKGGVPFQELLRILDVYPHQVHTKGSVVPFVADTIVITSNYKPWEWYPGVSAERLAPLLRRLTSIMEMTVPYAGGPQAISRFALPPGAVGVAPPGRTTTANVTHSSASDVARLLAVPPQSPNGEWGGSEG